MNRSNLLLFVATTWFCGIVLLLSLVAPKLELLQSTISDRMIVLEQVIE